VPSDLSCLLISLLSTDIAPLAGTHAPLSIPASIPDASFSCAGNVSRAFSAVESAIKGMQIKITDDAGKTFAYVATFASQVWPSHTQPPR